MHIAFPWLNAFACPTVGIEEQLLSLKSLELFPLSAFRLPTVLCHHKVHEARTQQS
jgi:hypothetical protein